MLRWLLVVSVIALVLCAAAFYRWELLGVLAFTGVGVLATVPVQSSLLADAFPVRARPHVFAVYMAIGVAGFVIGPLVVAASTAVFDGTAEWRAPFVVLAAGRGRARVRGRSAARRPARSRRGRGDVR